MRIGDVTLNPAGFVLCPAELLAVCGVSDFDRVRQVYHAAFEQARDLVRPAITERLMAASWN